MIWLPLLAGGSRWTIAGNDAENQLAQARQAVAGRDHVRAWKALDLARSNYPEAEIAARDVLRSLNEICTEDQKVGRVAVATWPDGKAAAVTLTFDDALPSGYRQAAPDLERRRWLGTYYLTNKVLATQDKGPWKALALRGHEIGCHTVSHFDRDLPTLARSTIDFELDCGQFVTPVVTAEPILTFAYPDSNAGEPNGPLRTEVRRRYLAARSGKAGDGQRVSKASPDDPDLLVSFPILSATDPAEYELEIQRAVLARGWLIFMFHAIIERDGWQPISEQCWRACLDLLGRRDDVWIAPLAGVAGYIQSRRTAVTDWGRDGDRVWISVRSELDRTPPDMLLTITVRVPRSWSEVTLSSEEDSITVRDGEVTFNLRPDGRRVFLERVSRPGGVP